MTLDHEHLRWHFMATAVASIIEACFGKSDAVYLQDLSGEDEESVDSFGPLMVAQLSPSEDIVDSVPPGPVSLIP